MDTHEERAQCRSCHWWAKHPVLTRDGLPAGECRLRGPAIFQRNDERHTLITRWPMTVALDFCGSHRASRAQGGAQ